MADLATLMIAVDSRPVKQASGDLDNMTASAGRTGRSVDTLIAANARMATALATSNKSMIDATRYLTNMQMDLERVGKSALQIQVMEIKMAAARAPTAELAREIRSVGAELIIAERNAERQNGTMGAFTGVMDGAGKRTKLASHEVLQLSYNVQDLAIQLMSGQNPMVAFAQQGSQIAGTMQASELGVKGFAKATVEMIATTTRALLVNPIFLGIAAAVATVSAAVNFMADDITKTSGVTVSASHVMLGAFDVIKNGITNTVTRAFQAMGLDVGAVWDSVVEMTRKAVNIIIGLATFTPRAFVTAFEVLPAAIGDIFYSAANFAIQGINNLTVKATAILNSFIKGANVLLGEVGLAIPTISPPQIAALENSYAGAAKRAMTAFVKVGADTFQRDFVGEISSVIGDAAVKRALEDKAGETGKDVGKAMGKGAKEALAGEFEGVVGEISDIAQEALDRSGARIAGDLEFQFFEDQAKIRKDIEDNGIKIVENLRDKSAQGLKEAFEKNVQTAEKFGDDVAQIIGGKLGDAIGGAFSLAFELFPNFAAGLGKEISEAFSKGAATGRAVDDILGKIGVKSSKTGSQLGGAAGQMIGQSLGSSLSALGSAAGPIGAIAGSVLGGVIGGLLKKTKKASATIEAAAGSLDVGAIVGNSAKFKQTANTLANAVIDGITKIADQLGATLTDEIDISIGKRDKKFTVDITGAGRTKGSGVYKFATESEAIEFAIRNAIEDGVFGGLRAGSQALLRGAGDLENQLQKAMDFEGVFKSLRAETDPLGAALDTLDKRFAGLILTFTEAGATAGEWVDLERYYQLEREKAIKEGNAKALEAVQEARDQLTAAYERESEAILTTLERFQTLTADLESFRLSLAEQLMTAEEIYKAAKANFDEVAKLAAEGNQKAIEDLIAVSQKYLDASKDFLTPEEYNREIENVMKAVDLAIVATKTMEEYAQLQLDALNNSVDGLITVNDSVLSVRDAIQSLQEALARVPVAPATTLVFNAPAVPTSAAGAANGMPDFANMTPDQAVAWWQSQQATGGSVRMFANGGFHNGGLRLVGENGPELEVTGPSRIYNANQTAAMLGGSVGVEQQIADLRTEMRASLYAIAKNTGKTSDQLQRWDGDGLPETRTWTV